MGKNYYLLEHLHLEAGAATKKIQYTGRLL